MDLLDRKYKLQCNSGKENRLRKQYLKKVDIFFHKTESDLRFWNKGLEQGLKFLYTIFYDDIHLFPTKFILIRNEHNLNGNFVTLKIVTKPTQQIS